ncbi:nuclear transport factor 2 family protein [Kineococcus sp. T13]|nr:nuclear transport factor 2 family protein [Kineococcus vitellinus]NAZ76665.1 nuclear transport factor 2 family protein [Kineococcus vitellinus]
MHANLLEVFAERDPERRRAAIERTYVPEVTFADPEETVVGRQALDEKAQRLLDESPGFVFSPGGPVQVVQDLGYLAWRFGPEGGEPVVRGADVALVEGGLITAVYTMLLPE